MACTQSGKGIPSILYRNRCPISNLAGAGVFEAEDLPGIESPLLHRRSRKRGQTGACFENLGDFEGFHKQLQSGKSGRGTLSRQVGDLLRNPSSQVVVSCTLIALDIYNWPGSIPIKTQRGDVAKDRCGAAGLLLYWSPERSTDRQTGKFSPPKGGSPAPRRGRRGTGLPGIREISSPHYSTELCPTEPPSSRKKPEQTWTPL